MPFRYSLITRERYDELRVDAGKRLFESNSIKAAGTIRYVIQNHKSLTDAVVLKLHERLERDIYRDFDQTVKKGSTWIFLEVVKANQTADPNTIILRTAAGSAGEDLGAIDTASVMKHKDGINNPVTGVIQVNRSVTPEEKEEAGSLLTIDTASDSTPTEPRSSPVAPSSAAPVPPSTPPRAQRPSMGRSVHERIQSVQRRMLSEARRLEGMLEQERSRLGSMSSSGNIDQQMHDIALQTAALAVFLGEPRMRPRMRPPDMELLESDGDDVLEISPEAMAAASDEQADQTPIAALLDRVIESIIPLILNRKKLQQSIDRFSRYGASVGNKALQLAKDLPTSHDRLSRYGASYGLPRFLSAVDVK